MTTWLRRLREVDWFAVVLFAAALVGWLAFTIWLWSK